MKQPNGKPNEKFDSEKVRQFFVKTARHVPYLMKDEFFEHQLEYRFVWLTDHEVKDFIDIKVPEAIIHCTELNRLDGK